ncbi:TPA: hypothetical protein ACGZ9C_003128 [Elizabethkingia anophelis]
MDSLSNRLKSSFKEEKSMVQIFEELNKEINMDKLWIEIKLFNQNELPEPSNEDKDFSEDVFIVDQDNLNGIAYYSFKDSEWMFHTETMVDYFEEGNETKFWWYYPPVTIKNEVDNGK